MPVCPRPRAQNRLSSQCEEIHIGRRLDAHGFPVTSLLAGAHREDTTTEGSFMATRDMTTDERRFEKSRPTVTREETKVSFLTTEFWAMIGVIAAILVAAQQADNFDAPRAWTLVAAVAIGYMVSRGLAKSGSDYRDRNGDQS